MAIVHDKKCLNEIFLLKNNQVSDEEEEEEEEYEYVEEYEEEDAYMSKKKQNKNSHQGAESKKPSAQTSNRSKHLTKEKTSHGDKEETPTDPKGDIRNAFFKASANAKAKPEKSASSVSNINNENDDDLANEIMLELQRKKSVSHKATVMSKPKASPSTVTSQKPTYSQIPFSVSSNISQSPAHKRKLSPLSASHGQGNADNKLHMSASSRCHKKIELDDDLVQQLFDSDSQNATECSIMPNNQVWLRSYLNIY